jgi:hypothetical protein
MTVSERSLAIIGTILTLEQLYLAARTDKEHCYQWYVNHDQIREQLSGLLWLEG